MFFIVNNSKRGPLNSKAVVALEKYLIEHAYERNPTGLINKQHAKQPPWSIKGGLRSGRGSNSKSSTEFKKMFWFE